MDLEKIEGLVNIIENSSLTEFTIEEGDLKITMSKLSHPPIVGAGMIAASSAAPVADTAALEEKADEEDEILFITSPIVGTFYSAAAPDIPAFVRVGDHVKAGQTVCILEAMKLMNEIESEFDGTVKEILVENEQMVEFGQPMFVIE